MRGYDRNEGEEYDDYEDEGVDRYEDESDEYEEEGEEEEERKPTAEELEYLELRRKLKERYRKNIKKESSSALANSREKKKQQLPYDNYGSFFGPSQPVISQRVIQESKSLLETQHLAPRVSNSNHSNGKTSASSTTGSKPAVYRQLPKVNEMQKKVQTLKVSRDYSFLSNDGEPPAPKKQPPALRREPPTHRRELLPPGREIQAPRRDHSAPRRDPPARNVSVPNSEARLAQVPPRSKQPMGNSGRSVHGAREERKPVSSNGQIHSRAEPHRSSSANRPNSTSVDPRKQHISSNGVGPGRPAGPKAPPSKMPVTSLVKKATAPGARNPGPSARMPAPPRMLPSVQKRQLEQRRGLEEPNRSKIVTKQSVASSRPQINRPLKQISSHATTQDHRPKKRPPPRRFSDDESDEDAEAFSMLRSLLGPRRASRYDDDDDDSCMEAGFDDIMAEEKRSARIAKQEDDEELRLIEAEEREERMRKLAKKRKLGH